MSLPCSCGFFHAEGNCFSVLFSMPNHMNVDEPDSYTIASSSSVDCTLSLGTPSTRQTEDKSMTNLQRSGSCMSNLCWDIFQPNKPHPSTSASHTSSQGSILNNFNGDPLLARRCANCDTTSTPLWRNGPRGPKSLCNACGIRYKKEERRATTTNNTGPATIGAMESQFLMSQHNQFRFIEDGDRDSSTTGVPFLSWRLNLPDRPSLVHEFT
ncbi:hypothetical protein NE237_016851 [Protea cynaroides]|uniref:GATA-type domain-containing protein n=1 Tax=Protea cynaroides TaxID=273540 RepID=A0A9Q0HEL0_9MAGN|nr:hypothetical protein NE237_016851 [Protea cynaroides]